MEEKTKRTILNELSNRVEEAYRCDDNSAGFELNNFYEWFAEKYVRNNAQSK